jgi:hypothetical protein
MVFCERFHMTPFEFRRLPYQLITLWSAMAKVADAAQKTTYQENSQSRQT